MAKRARPPSCCLTKIFIRNLIYRHLRMNYLGSTSWVSPGSFEWGNSYSLVPPASPTAMNEHTCLVSRWTCCFQMWEGAPCTLPPQQKEKTAEQVLFLRAEWVPNLPAPWFQSVPHHFLPEKSILLVASCSSSYDKQINNFYLEL